MFAAFLVILFVGFILLGVPIAFSLGFVSFVGIASLPSIPNIVVFQKMFNGLNSFTLFHNVKFAAVNNLHHRLFSYKNNTVQIEFRLGGNGYNFLFFSRIIADIINRSPLVTEFAKWQIKDFNSV